MAIVEINKLRKKFNYKEDNIHPYKDFCYQHRREKGEMKYLKVEYYLLMYQISDIKQKKRLKNKIQKLMINCNDKLYSDYVKFKVDLNQSIEISDYLNFPYFYQELKTIISSNDEFKTTWHDIELKFNDSIVLSQFKNLELINEYSFTGEDSYYRSLGNKIIKLEKALKRVYNQKELENYYKKLFKKILENAENLNEFLKNNHSESIHLMELIRDTQEVHKFLEYLDDFENCKVIDPSPILNFKIPRSYSCIEEFLNKLKINRKFNIQKLKKWIKMRLCEHFKSDTEILVPFPPIFYDLAFDYISYPDNKNDKSALTGLLGKLNVFGKK